MPTPSVCTVSGALYQAGGAAISGAVIKAYVTSPFTDVSGNYVAAGVLAQTTSASDGTWSLGVVQTQAIGHSVTFQFEYPLGNNQSASVKFAAVIPNQSTANFSDLVNLSTGSSILAAAPTTDALAEGVVNLYFTQARARAAISASSPVAYNSTTGVISVAAIPNADLATMAAHTFKGNNTASSAIPIDLTATQLTAELNVVVGDSGSGGTKGLVPAAASGDAAANKFLKADGTFAATPAPGSGTITNSQLATMADQTFKGNVSGSTTSPSDLSVSQVKTALSLTGTNSGDVTVGTFGSTPNSSGASVSGQVITIQPTDGTHPGSVSTGTQTIAGDKTLTGTLTLPNGSGSLNSLQATGQANTGITFAAGAGSDTGVYIFSGGKNMCLMDGNGGVGQPYITFSQRLILEAGDVNLPSIEFGEAGLGVYTPAAHTMSLAAGSVDQLKVDSSNGITIPPFGAGVVKSSSSGVLSSVAAANLTDAGTDGITVTGGTGAVLTTASIAQHVADTTHNGYLSSTDWNTFNGKQASGSYITALTGDVTASGPGSVAAAVAKINGTTVSGTTGTSNVVFSSAPTLSNPVVGTQTQGDSSTKAASTAYVDTAVSNAVAGINPAVAVNAATTAASDTSGLTYSNGSSGIGATFTGTNNTALTIDGFTFTAVGQRLLVKNDTQSPSGAFNGVYSLTQLQASLTPPVLTRALDFDAPSDMNNTGSIPVISGTVNGTTSWVLTSLVVTVGTTPLTFTQFTKNPASYLLASNNLSDVGTKATAFNNLSPMSASGDIIYGGASGTGTRLAKGADGQVLTLASGLPSWAASSGGSSTLTVVSKTANYTATSSDDLILCNSSGGAFTVTLPAAASNSGKVLRIKKTDSGLNGNAVTVQGNGAETIDGSNTYLLHSQYQELIIASDATNWQVISTVIRSKWELSTSFTYAGLGTVSNNNVWMRREGDSLRIRGYVTAGSTTGVGLTVIFPNSITIDSTKMSSPSSSASLPGQAYRMGSLAFGSNDLIFQPFYDGSNTGKAFFARQASSNIYSAINGSVLASNEAFAFEFIFPVTAWEA